MQVDTKRRSLTDEHKRKISESTKGRKSHATGKKMSELSRYKNMKNHLQWNVDLSWLMNFEIDKLIILNGMLSRDRVSVHFTTEKYIQFVERFYNSDSFNKSYQLYLEHNKNRWFAPSLDHIIPLSKHGTYDLDNLPISSALISCTYPSVVEITSCIILAFSNLVTSLTYSISPP